MKKILIFICFLLVSLQIMAQDTTIPSITPIVKATILSIAILLILFIIVLIPRSFSYKKLYSKIVKNARFIDQGDYGYFEFLENGQPKKKQYLESDMNDFELILPNHMQYYEIEIGMVEFKFLGIKYKNKESIVHIVPQDY